MSCAEIAHPIFSGKLGRGLWCENLQEDLIKSAGSDKKCALSFLLCLLSPLVLTQSLIVPDRSDFGNSESSL